MKRILVLSDSHGNVNNMVTAVGRLHPDMIIHLGDCWADAEPLIMKLLQGRKKSQSRMTSRNRKLLQVVMRKLAEIRVMQVMVVRLQTVRKTM